MTGASSGIGDELAVRLARQGRRLARTVEAFGGVDCLVNDAGISMLAGFEEVTDLSAFEKLMPANYLGAGYATHFALPELRRRRGLVVAISSLTGKFGAPTCTAYGASKHAMQGFFDALRIELSGSGVALRTVSPGFVQTEIRARALGPDGEPLGASPRDERRGNLSVEACASRILRAMERRERDVLEPGRARLRGPLAARRPRAARPDADRVSRPKGA